MEKKLNCPAYIQDIQNGIENTVNISKLKGKTILITGATGLIGSFIIDMLRYYNKENNADMGIFALGRNREKMNARFGQGDSDIHYIVQDVTLPINAEEDFDFIIHAAGDGYPEAFRLRPVETMTPAVVGTINLLEYARNHKVNKFVYISSGEVYGKIEKEHAFLENESGIVNSMEERSCYPMAKRCAETLCASYTYEYGLDISVARLSHTYGPIVNSCDNRATVQFLNDAINHEDIILNSHGRQMRSYTYVVDAASAVLTILLNGVNKQAYNVANPNSQITIAGFAETLARICGVNCVYRIPDENKVKELSPFEYAILDSTQLESLGWKGRYSIEDGIKQMWEIANA